MQGSEPRVRVAYFVPPSQHFAGIERVVHEIATGLMESHGDVLDVHVLFSTRYDDRLLTNTPYTLHVLDVDRLRNLPTALRSCVAAQDFDILVCPQIEASVLAWFATRGLHLPLFITHLHGNPGIEEAEGSRATRIAFSLFRHVISRRISGILAVSPSLRQYAAGSLTRHTQVYFAKNPVRDIGTTAPTPSSDDQFHFLTVARLSHQKGQDILLRALAIARRDLPHVTLTLVGSGKDETELKQLSRRLGLDDIVVFAGSIPDPTEYFRAADCFVLPSRWEGFGLVLVEALQFGLPLLAADCDFGPSDIITDSRIGDLVAVGSAEALAEGMKRAARRVSDAADVATRRAVASTYTRGVATEMHVSILKQIAANRPARSRRLAGFLATTHR